MCGDAKVNYRWSFMYFRGESALPYACNHPTSGLNEFLNAESRTSRRRHCVDNDPHTSLLQVGCVDGHPTHVRCSQETDNAAAIRVMESGEHRP